MSSTPLHTPSFKRRFVSLIGKLRRLMLEKAEAVDAVERLIDNVLADGEIQQPRQ